MTKAELTRSKKFLGFTIRSRCQDQKLNDDKKQDGIQDASSKVEDTESRNDDVDNDDAIECQCDEQEVVEETKVEEGENSSDMSSKNVDNIGAKLLSYVRVGGKKTKEGNENDQVLSDIVASIREQIEQGSESETKDSFSDIIKLINAYRGKMAEVAKKYFGSINLNKLSPTAVLYYIEREDEVKNPSWKRRQHRYMPELKIEKVHELYDALKLAQLCYADTADEIRAGLLKHKTPYDLVYVNVQSSPGQPANFVAVQHDQHSFRRSFGKKEKTISSSLRVIIGVRGTKSASDAITDLLCDTVEYNGGLAHSFMVESGKYIAEKHLALIEDLRTKSGKKKVIVTLIGHSLGAGAASIAGMELHNYAQNQCVPNGSVKGIRQTKSIVPTIIVKVIGFGCPALVSDTLAKDATYITTVVNDADVVPRLSGITVANLLVDIMGFDWMEYVQRDVQFSLNELQQRHSRIFKEMTRQKISETIDTLLTRHLQNTLLKEQSQPRIVPEVYPPGQCIHLYRDGCGIRSSQK
jgi:Lipase (class 3)